MIASQFEIGSQPYSGRTSDDDAETDAEAQAMPRKARYQPGESLG